MAYRIVAVAPFVPAVPAHNALPVSWPCGIKASMKPYNKRELEKQARSFVPYMLGAQGLKARIPKL